MNPDRAPPVPAFLLPPDVSPGPSGLLRPTLPHFEPEPEPALNVFQTITIFVLAFVMVVWALA